MKFFPKCVPVWQNRCQSSRNYAQKCCHHPYPKNMKFFQKYIFLSNSRNISFYSLGIMGTTKFYESLYIFWTQIIAAHFFKLSTHYWKSFLPHYKINLINVLRVSWSISKPLAPWYTECNRELDFWLFGTLNVTNSGRFVPTLMINGYTLPCYRKWQM